MSARCYIRMGIRAKLEDANTKVSENADENVKSYNIFSRLGTFASCFGMVTDLILPENEKLCVIDPGKGSLVVSFYINFIHLYFI